MDINRLKLAVKNFLQTKKYIVVFDDVWEPTHWDAIHLAFPTNQFGSRIVITTRKKDVGQAASTSEAGGSVYALKALPNADAMRLFCRKAFSGGTSCPHHLKQICEKILGACKGLPLAIEVIGSNLARKSQRTEEWELFYKGIGAEMERYDMTKLLSLSYHDLPLHLKNCFLYLSIIPEDTIIDRDDLALLWVGEGFVPTVHGLTLEEVAESCVSELVDRCLLQVAMTNDRGTIEAIRDHDIIRHIILLKAIEHNKTTIFQGRLSVQSSISSNSKQAQGYCKFIRTLYLCKKVGGHISKPNLSNLLSHGRKLLKVLDLTDAQLDKFPHEVTKLFHLKYLSLKHTNVKFVPKSIGMLQSLQSLILEGTHVTELPLEIQNLRHLIVGQFDRQPFIRRIDDVKGVGVSFRIGSLKSLQYPLYIESNQVGNIKVVTEIGKLIHLRVLGITKLKKEDGKELCSSLGNLKELRQLDVYSNSEEEFIDFQYCKSSDLQRLHTLILSGRLEKCPELLSSLGGLAIVELRFSKLRDDPLKCLQDLPSLVNLNLTGAYQGESLCFKAGGFRQLKYLQLFLLEELRWVTVEENALPSLQVWLTRLCQSIQEIPTGIEYLMSLQELEFLNMSNEFMNKLENLDKQSEAYTWLLQISQVVSATWTDGRWSENRRLNKETGIFNNVI